MISRMVGPAVWLPRLAAVVDALILAVLAALAVGLTVIVARVIVRRRLAGDPRGAWAEQALRRAAWTGGLAVVAGQCGVDGAVVAVLLAIVGATALPTARDGLRAWRLIDDGVLSAGATVRVNDGPAGEVLAVGPRWVTLRTEPGTWQIRCSAIERIETLPTAVFARPAEADA